MAGWKHGISCEYICKNVQATTVQLVSVRRQPVCAESPGFHQTGAGSGSSPRGKLMQLLLTALTVHGMPSRQPVSQWRKLLPP